MHSCNPVQQGRDGRFQKFTIQQDQVTVNSNIGEKPCLKMKIKVEVRKIDSVTKARLMTKCQKINKVERS